MTACASCGSDVPEGARFCPACGAAVEVRADERRIVTVLFADVVGFTALSEARDPESVKYTLDRCFERLAADVTSHGGHVDKIVGDELMAVFGAPVAHEDDPERAVRAALQMRRTLADHARQTGGNIDVRIGINTGEVLVGNLRAGGDVTALGDVVNTASRLQGSVEPGQVLVGRATYEATKDVIGYEPVGSLALKGRGSPVDAWRAVEALGPPGARPGRTRTPLFGRKAELGMLWHALGTTVEHRRPHLVLLVGEAGMGKTVLVQEAMEVARAQHDALVIEGRCLPYGEANPWWPVAEALRQACGIDPDDPAEAAAAKCRESVASVVGAAGEGAEAARVSEGLLYIMGFAESLSEVEPSRAKDEAVRSIQLALEANARQRPVVIVLSEIHWADQLVLDLIDTMLERLRGLPIALLATARPDLEQRWSPKPGRHNLLVLNLDALGPDDGAALARSMLPDDAGEDLVHLVVERSGGNPLFIYELSLLLAEGRMPGPGAPGIPELPATLRGLVAARIDALDRADRSTLEDAAVVGRRGPVEGLAALGQVRGEVRAEVRLRALTERDLLVVGDGEYEFKSDLVRDVAYETLTKADRARRHAAVADWLVKYARRTEREEEHLERIAHHYAVAAELTSEIGAVEEVPMEEVRARALDWLERAVTRAEERETPAASVHLLEHAIALLDEGDAVLRGRFLLSRARGLASVRDMERSHADIAEALRVADGTADPALRARALTVRGEVEQREGELTRSAATLDQAVAAWREVGDRRGEAEALRLRGFTAVHRGELDAAETDISRALEISRELSDRRGEAWALQNLAWAAFSRGDNDLAEERLTASADLFEQIGDVGGRSWAVGLLAYVWYFKGRLDEAGEMAEPSIAFSREMGDRWGYGMMLNLLASVRLWQGRTGEAVERSREATRLFERIDDEMGQVNAANTLATALTLQGRSDEAAELVRRYLPVARAIYTGRLGAALTATTVRALVGDGEGALRIFDALKQSDEDEVAGASARALAFLVLGRFEDAYEASREGLDDADDPPTRANAGCIHALASAANGQPDEAIATADEVIGIGGTYVDRTRAQLARALASAQLGQMDEAAKAIEQARELTTGTEDVVHRLLVDLAAARIAGDPLEHARAALQGAGVRAEAWETVFRHALAAAEV